MEFREVAHSGGRITLTWERSAEGQRGWSMRWENSRPNPSSLFGVWALYDGTPVDVLPMGGIGWAPGRPPVSDCVNLLVASDSEGRFGHNCPRCKAYWRSEGAWARHCVRCGLRAPSIDFLSDAQRAFLSHFGGRLLEFLESDEDIALTIDMDEVADAAFQGLASPTFPGSEEAQQLQYKCTNCNAFNDILGEVGYCTRCGMRNDFDELRASKFPAMRQRLVAGAPAELVLREAVSAFDSFVAQFAGQFARRIPMIKERRDRLSKPFHDLEETAKIFGEWFGVKILHGLTAADRFLIQRLFQRRHVYEHNGGMADKIYIERSGDALVRIGQKLSEEPSEVHRLLDDLLRMAKHVHQGFHEIFPYETKEEARAPLLRFAPTT